MPDDKTYNGWTNYETWCVHLWLTNDEGEYRVAVWRSKRASTVREAAEDLKNWVFDNRPDTSEDMPASMFTDLLGAALSEVNWTEIAKSFREED